MKCFILIATIFSLAQNLIGQVNTTKTVIYSQKVKDSFELFVSTPKNWTADKIYNVVYYCDANLKSGNKLRQMLTAEKYQNKVENTIFVGFGHIGKTRVLRRRDFIPPLIKNGDTLPRSKNYGQTEACYQFLKTELIPTINAKYKTNSANNSIVGHSLGGLFAFYCLFKNEHLFKNYFALSPALWIEHYLIYQFNKMPNNTEQDRFIYFSAGGRETINRIKKGTNEMQIFLNGKKYPNLHYEYQIHRGKTHNSQVELSLDYLLKMP